MKKFIVPTGEEILYDDDVILPGALSLGSHGYAQCFASVWGTSNRKVMLFHRWLLGLDVGDKRIADHIDRNPLNCQISNLRILDPKESNFNRGVTSTAILSYPCRDKWQAKVRRNGRVFYLGSFDSQEEAHERSAAFIKEYDAEHFSHL